MPASFQLSGIPLGSRAATVCIRIAALGGCLFLAGCSIPEAQFRRFCREHFKVSVVDEAGWATVRSAAFFRDVELDPFPFFGSFMGHAIMTETKAEPLVSIAIGKVYVPHYTVTVDDKVVARVSNPIWVKLPYESASTPSCTIQFRDEFRIFGSAQAAARAS